MINKMPEKPEKDPLETADEESVGNLSEDQKKRRYYYDDAHGYQTFRPGEDEDAEDDEEEAG